MRWITKPVYHYCSCEAFISILSNHTLRITNIKKSNDYTEIVNSLDLFQRSLRIACHRFNSKNPDDFEFAQLYRETDIATLVERSIINDSLTYYAVCFSEDGDSLSQWRGYADNATGIAIGFDRQYLHQINDHKNMKFMSIEYNKQDVQEDLVDYIVRKFERVKEDLKNLATATDYGNAISAVISSFVYNAAFYKNSAFSEEKEWRLVFILLARFKIFVSGINHKICLQISSIMTECLNIYKQSSNMELLLGDHYLLAFAEIIFFRILIWTLVLLLRFLSRKLCWVQKTIWMI